MSITYLIGDATRPPVPEPKFIAHVCNDLGAWGAGFVRALSARWPLAERVYRGGSFELGTHTIARVEYDVWVFNMVAQHGLRSRSNPHPRPGGAPAVPGRPGLRGAPLQGVRPHAAHRVRPGRRELG